MAAEIKKVPIMIRYEWLDRKVHSSSKIQPPQLLPPSQCSEWFCTDALPNIRFNISIGQLKNKQLFVVVSKIPSNPAKANIKVTLEYCDSTEVAINNWINNCTVDKIDFKHTVYQGSTWSGSCVITWGGFIDPRDPIPPINLYRQMKPFFNVTDFADIEIMVDDTKIPAHKIVLAAQSSVLSTMLKTNMSESTNNLITIEDISVDIMKLVIHFLYSGEIDAELDIDAVLSVLNAAEKYQINDLKQSCADILSGKITVENSLKIVEAAHLFRVPQLIECMNIFMVANKHDIIQLDDFKDLHARKPDVLLDFINRSIREEKNFFCLFCRT